MINVDSEPLVVDPADPIRVEPLPRTGAVYRLRRPRLADRVRYRRGVAAAGGRQWSDFDLLGEVAAGIREVMAGEENTAERDRLLGMIEAYRQGAMAVVRRGLDGDLDKLSEEERLVEMRAVLRPPEVDHLVLAMEPHLPRYRDMLADNITYRETAGIVAARLFLSGWEGGGLPAFRRGRDGVDDELLEHVLPAHLAQIGDAIEAAMTVSAERGKGSASRSGSPNPAPPISSTSTTSSDPESTTSAPSSGCVSTDTPPA